MSTQAVQPCLGVPCSHPQGHVHFPRCQMLFLHDQLLSVDFLQVQPTYAFQVNTLLRSSRKDAHDFTQQFINPISNYHLHVHPVLK